ncbi:amino acid ABC transporter substrate-binding protein [Streptomyces sp. DSM 42041]|uniref:Amino acid ABC transporter substrate-binding protein n=1 Tax=Streptomyces hazeniae TaxID=3075538 RepID=A0ABU2NWH0_9ACTN|nr:amino acid ABC transporter substrate-binding protein [Streptomyces sp. DSM 42041]MDT0381341.1 amino acid ABC transporter substrate-binding protein [Streptomyces sp. DSM 42041]
MKDWLYRTFLLNRLRKALSAAGAVALLLLGHLFVPDALDRFHRCADGVREIDAECIGVNGSGYDFGTPGIGKVADAVAAENRRIASVPHVTVAMMLPLQPASRAGQDQLRSDLQGAYLGQRRANQTGELPKLRLVLANPGSGYRHQEEVVDRLAEMARSPRHRLRAVTGFNLSLSETEAAIDRLTNDLGIPVLASRVSADDLANDETGPRRFDGLARVIPTNGRQADALAAFHGDLPDRRTVLVTDTRPNDIYVASLADAFRRDEPGRPGPKDQEFESPSLDEAGSTGNDFSLIGHNICQSEAEVVYFAGRPVHLRLFALKLAEVPCGDRHYTVVSGSGAATLARYMDEGDWRTLRGDDADEPLVTVRYAAPGHPDAWDAELRAWRAAQQEGPSAEQPPAHLTQPQEELQRLEELLAREEPRMGDGDLQDSRTMLVYDGVRTIARAVFLAHSGPGTDGPVPPAERVAAQWKRLESQHRVYGTSGWICLTNAGNPYNKPVAVVELAPGDQELAFVGLAWPESRPQPPECVVPSHTG